MLALTANAVFGSHEANLLQRNNQKSTNAEVQQPKAGERGRRRRRLTVRSSSILIKAAKKCHSNVDVVSGNVVKGFSLAYSCRQVART